MNDETDTNNHPWPDRQCVVPRCGRMFAPTTALQRRCAECIAARPPRRARRKSAPGPVAPPAEASVTAAQATAPAPPPRNGRATSRRTNDATVTAADVLELAGYRVRRLLTPSGALLLVR